LSGLLAEHWDDEKTDDYRCPEGHALRCQWRAFKNPRNHITKVGT
jgi:hypothetical protein